MILLPQERRHHRNHLEPIPRKLPSNLIQRINRPQPPLSRGIRTPKHLRSPRKPLQGLLSPHQLILLPTGLLSQP